MTFNPDLPTKTDKHFPARRLYNIELEGWDRQTTFWAVKTPTAEHLAIVARNGDIIDNRMYVMDYLGKKMINTPRTVTRYVHWFWCKGVPGNEIIRCEASNSSDWASVSRSFRHKIRTDGPFEIEVPPDFET